MSQEGDDHDGASPKGRGWEIDSRVMRRLSRMGSGAFGLVCCAMEEILRREWLRFREIATNQLTVETVHGWFSFTVKENSDTSVIVLNDAMWKYHPLFVALRCRNIHAIDTKLLSFSMSNFQWDELFSGRKTTAKGVEKIVASVGKLISACRSCASSEEAINSMQNMWIARRREGDYELLDADHAVRFILSVYNGVLTVHSAELVLEWQMVEAIWPAGRA